MAGGRPTIFTQDLADDICERIIEGESLRSICKADNMPNCSTVFRWMVSNEQFCKQYEKAKVEQAEMLADEIIAIADEECTMIKHGDGDDEKEVEVVFDSTAIARNRLRVDARKWIASKLKPKKYGDKIDHEVKGNISITFNSEDADI